MKLLMALKCTICTIIYVMVFHFTDPSNKNSAFFTIEKLTAPEKITKPTCQSLLETDNALKVIQNLVQWIKSMSLFSQLPSDDKRALIENAWHELFIVTAVQLGYSFQSGKI